MATIKDLGLIADAVYQPLPAVDGWVVPPDRVRVASGRTDGFQAATFLQGRTTVIAFRGTAQAVDVAVDLELGSGMNTGYFSAGEDYVAAVTPSENTWVVGHSLGGAIAQVVANRRGFKMVTFNAPGVAVFASRNIGSATVGMTAVRTTGMLASAVLHPMQAARDVRAAFNVVRGLNICLEYDVISQFGVHYGEVIRIPGPSMDPRVEHRMTTMNRVLKDAPIGQRDLVTI